MIRVGHIKETSTNLEEYIICITNDDKDKSINSFKTLVQRALNCWPDAPPELKELGDKLTHGRILQDYYHTRTDIKKEKLPLIS